MTARAKDDPRAAAAASMNMTPMIDVTFQLIIVFLCSMKFRTLDERVDAHLPKHLGPEETAPAVPVHEALARLRIDRAPGAAAARVWLLGEPLGSTAEGEPLWGRLGARIAALRARDPALVGEIDAGPEVEHGEVMRALDGFLGAEVRSVRFRGTPPGRRSR